MNQWWYGLREGKQGPVYKEEISNLIIKGYVTTDTLFWNEKTDQWNELKNIAELRKYVSAGEALRSKPGRDNGFLLPFSGAWRRFFARVFDLTLECVLAFFLLNFFAVTNLADRFNSLSFYGAMLFFAYLILPMALLLDAIIYKIAGNTLGKKLLGIRVGYVNAAPLTFFHYLKRNFSVWIFGLGLGIFWFGIITMIRQSNRLGKNQQTTYDARSGFRVRNSSLGCLKMTFVVIFFAEVYLYLIS